MMMRPAVGRLGYRPDLDGLRAVAVLLVIVSHARFPVVNDGGNAGVTAFFVLSGYLITRLLRDEQEATGHIDLPAFYRRRVVRLGPALLLLTAFIIVVGLVHGWPGDWGLGMAACLLYVGNWVEAFGGQIGPFGHTWTLAIEEQFYLLWPALVMLLGRRWSIWPALYGLVLGATAQLWAHGDFSFYSTITRGDAILAGCVLGILKPKTPPWTGLAGIAILVFAAYLQPNYYLMVPVCVFAAALVVTSEWSALGVLAPIGRRAYGLYLWNLPFTLLFGAIGGVLTFPAAALSYEFVERPITRRFRAARSTGGSARSPRVGAQDSAIQDLPPQGPRPEPSDE
jgi:peptidoglycan/LPS O-acetylase OafA/YrhL